MLSAFHFRSPVPQINLLLLFLLFGSTSLHAKSYNLDELFQQAASTSAGLQAQNEAVKQVQARYYQAWGSILPTVDGVGSYTWQEKVANPNVNSGNQSTARITGTQPLFRGGQEIFGIRQTSRLLQAQKSDREAQRLELFDSVAQVFYNYLSLKHELENLDQIIQTYRKRLGELNKRVSIGRSQKSDALATEVSIAELEAQRVRLEGQKRAEWVTLIELTQISEDDQLVDNIVLASQPPTWEQLKQSIESHPRVQNARLQKEAASQAAIGAWGAHLPQLDLTGNYYLRRPGPLSDVEWDLRLDITIPLFSGGVSYQKTREAQARARELELRYRQTYLDVERELKRQLEFLNAGLNEIDKWKASLQKAEENYAEQRRQYELGLVNNIEVLNALNSRASAQRSFDKSRYQAKLTFTQLQLMAGVIGGITQP